MLPSEPRDSVGPVLQKGVECDAILDALHLDNADVTVIDRGAYVRVLVPARCVLRKQSVEQRLQRAFHLPSDLELVMPAFKGRLVIDADEVVWSFEGGAA